MPNRAMEGQLTDEREFSVRTGVVSIAIVCGLFAAALGISQVVTRSATAVFDVGGPGSHSELLVGILGLQTAGFGTVGGLYLWQRGVDWRRYLRIGEFSEWTAFYGSAVGLALMLIAVAATALFTLLGIEAAESQSGQATEPSFYLLLFVLSTFVAVPMEELFFRGLLQRHLEERLHPVVAITTASLLFMIIHANVTVGSGGAIIAMGMFFSFGVVLGASYTYTENLFVPILGHLIFNGVQILVRLLEVLS